MVLTVTYSIVMDDKDIEKIKGKLNQSPSLSPYKTLKDYLQDRLQGTVVVELEHNYDEDIGIKCKQRYFHIQVY